jgi:transposase
MPSNHDPPIMGIPHESGIVSFGISTADAQSIGVDISKATLDTHAYPVGQACSFPNTPNGFKALLKWLTAFDVTRVVFEPTGAYHHDFERTLGNAGIALCKINPLQARRYAQSRGKRAKTDAVGYAGTHGP